MYSLRLKLYISQRTENQRNVGLNVGFVYSLHSFLFPLLFTYSVELKRSYAKPYTAESASPHKEGFMRTIDSSDSGVGAVSEWCRFAEFWRSAMCFHVSKKRSRRTGAWERPLNL